MVATPQPAFARMTTPSTIFTTAAIASQVAKSAGCKAKGSCKQRTYRCLLAKAGKERTLVHCENSKQTTFIRFEFGA